MAKAVKKNQYLKDDSKRIEAVPLLIEKGVITTWQSIFNYIPRTAMATHLGMNNNRMKKLVDDPSSMTIETQAQIAAFLQVRYSVLSELTYKAIPIEKRLQK